MQNTKASFFKVEKIQMVKSILLDLHWGEGSGGLNIQMWPLGGGGAVNRISMLHHCTPRAQKYIFLQIYSSSNIFFFKYILLHIYSSFCNPIFY